MGNKIVKKRKSKSEKERKKDKTKPKDVYETKEGVEEKKEAEENTMNNSVDHKTETEEKKSDDENSCVDTEVVEVKAEHIDYASSFCDKIIKDAYCEMQVIIKDRSDKKIENNGEGKLSNTCLNRCEHASDENEGDSNEVYEEDDECNIKEDL